jgi:ubiquitin-protein ligase
MNQSNRNKLLIEQFLAVKLEGKTEGFDIAQLDNDTFEHFYILIKPLAGIYKDQYHIIELKTTSDKNSVFGAGKTYPIYPPQMKFLTDVWHTNISVTGLICLDMLKDHTKWAPTNDFCTIIRNILLLFDEPNNLSPFNGEASREHVDCLKKYDEMTKGKKLTVNDADKIRDLAFANFKSKADDVAKKNNLNKYYKYFPQLDNKLHDDDYKEYLADLSTMIKKVEKKIDINTKTDTNKPNNKPWLKYQKK